MRMMRRKVRRMARGYKAKRHFGRSVPWGAPVRPTSLAELMRLRALVRERGTPLGV